MRYEAKHGMSSFADFSLQQTTKTGSHIGVSGTLGRRVGGKITVGVIPGQEAAQGGIRTGGQHTPPPSTRSDDSGGI